MCHIFTPVLISNRDRVAMPAHLRYRCASVMTVRQPHYRTRAGNGPDDCSARRDGPSAELRQLGLLA